MFFTSKYRKLIPQPSSSSEKRKQCTSRSSNCPFNMNNSMKPLTQKQLELRFMIQKKFEKSKMKTYRYRRGRNNEELQSSCSSPSSLDIPEFSCLKTRYISLKEYHKVNEMEQAAKRNQYLLKNRKRTFNGQSSISPSNSNWSEGSGFKRKNIHFSGELSLEKKKKKVNEWERIGFQLGTSKAKNEGKRKLKTSLSMRENSPSYPLSQRFIFRKNNNFQEKTLL